MNNKKFKGRFALFLAIMFMLASFSSFGQVQAAEDVKEMIENRNTRLENGVETSVEVPGKAARVETLEKAAKVEAPEKGEAPIDKASNGVIKDGPVIGIDHPKKEGEVLLFKEAKPVEGKVNTWDLTLRIESKDAKTNTSIVLVIDRSGSMREQDRLVNTKVAAKNFVDSILSKEGANTKIGLVSYASKHFGGVPITKESDLTTDAKLLKTKIDGLKPKGGTNTQAGIRMAQEMLDADKKADKKYIVLLSDGEPTVSLVDGKEVGDADSMIEKAKDGKEYNHGESAKKEAKLAKDKGTEIYTVAAEAEADAIKVLKEIASKEEYAISTKDSSKLNSIFADIAGRIVSRITNPSVSDEMGKGFEIPKGSVKDMKFEPADTKVSYDESSHKLTWNPGSLSGKVEGVDGVRYAQITYRLELNDDILKAGDKEFFDTNVDASLTYMNEKGERTTVSFPKPQVNPVICTVEKELQDMDGKKVKEDKEFIVTVNNDKATESRPESKYILNASKDETSRKLVRDLSYDQEYSFKELYDGDEYKASYTVNGNDSNVFTIKKGEGKDIALKVVNRKQVANIEGYKTWMDNDNQDGKRPDKITIYLMANGVEVDRKEISEKDGWKWSFVGFPKYKDGKKINYTFGEEAVPGYTSQIVDNKVTNTHVPEKTSLKVTKIWDDKENQDGKRPELVTVKLLADGKDTGKTLELSEANKWQANFIGLDKYKDAKEIEYSVEEVKVEGYKTVLSDDGEGGILVKNCHTPELTKLEGAKTWVDNDNQDGKRPEKITVHLLANEVEVAHKEVTEKDGWKWSFDNLPKYEKGKAIRYTLTEDPVDGYTSQVRGLDVTNTHKVEKTKVNVSKKWDDKDDKDGLRPDSITVNLLANGQKTDKQVKLSKDNKWKATFKDLDVYKDGKKVVYTVEEVKVDGYKATISGDQEKGYVIKNVHEVHVEPKPQPKPQPKPGRGPLTGDRGIYISLAVIIVCGGILVLINRKKEISK